MSTYLETIASFDAENWAVLLQVCAAAGVIGWRVSVILGRLLQT